MKNSWPATVPEAVARIIFELSPDNVRDIRALPPDGVVSALHGTLGAYLRNAFGLWQGNTALLTACQAIDADGAAAVILLALWRRVCDGDEDLSTARALLADLHEPEEGWESPYLRQARVVCDATRRAAGLPPVLDNTDCRHCDAADVCGLGKRPFRSRFFPEKFPIFPLSGRALSWYTNIIDK